MFLFLAGLAAAGAGSAGAVVLIRASVLRGLAGAPLRRRRAAEGVLLGAAVAAGFLFLFQNVLVHDALWYYSYLRSALLDHDLDLFAEFALANPNGMYLPPPGTPIFHLGTAIVEAPLALAARPLAVALARAGIVPGGDGYGPVEVLAVTLTSVFLGLAAVVLTHRLARRVTPAAPALVAAVAMLYATPFAWFVFVWPAYPHAASACGIAIFLYAWHRAGAAPGLASLFGLGLLGGFLAVIHPQDAVYLALPGMDLVRRGWHQRRAARPWRLPALRSGAWLLLGSIAGFAPQMSAWMVAAGTPLPDVYGAIGDPFRFGHPALFDVLLSGYNGLFIWSPIALVALAGLRGVRRRDARLGDGLLLAFLLEWWAIASYGYWWGGASFGPRYFLSLWPVLTIGLAAAADAAARRVGPAATAALAGGFVYWNLLLMAQFRLEWIPHNQVPDFARVLARQFTEAPAALAAGLLAPFRWNRVFVLDTLNAAVESRSTVLVLLWGAGTAAIVASLLAAGSVLGAFRRPARDAAARSRTRLIGCATAAAAVLSAVTALAAREPGTRRIVLEAASAPRAIAAESSVLLRLAAPREGPTIETPTAVNRPAAIAAPGAGGPLALDLVTYLERGGARREGEPVAALRVIGSGCDAARYVLRAGFETAETAPGRVENLATRRHDDRRADPVQRWWQDDGSREHYFGQAYLARFFLPAACEPLAARLEVSPGPGTLILRNALVSRDRSGEAGP